MNTIRSPCISLYYSLFQEHLTPLVKNEVKQRSWVPNFVWSGHFQHQKKNDTRTYHHIYHRHIDFGQVVGLVPWQWSLRKVVQNILIMSFRIHAFNEFYEKWTLHVKWCRYMPLILKYKGKSWMIGNTHKESQFYLWWWIFFPEICPILVNHRFIKLPHLNASNMLILKLKSKTLKYNGYI